MKKIDAKTMKKIRKLHSSLEEAIAEANGLMTELCGLATEQADAAEAWFEDRSERWQESYEGEAYQEWIDTMRETADLMEGELDEIGDLEELFPEEPEAEPGDDEDEDDEEDEDEDEDEDDEEDDEDEEDEDE